MALQIVNSGAGGINLSSVGSNTSSTVLTSVSGSNLMDLLDFPMEQ